jgi:hypothetical protein
MDITYKEFYIYTDHLELGGLRNGGDYDGLGIYLEWILPTRNCVNSHVTWYCQN